MGLKEKAFRFRNEKQYSLYPWLQKLGIGSTITQNTYDEVNNSIQQTIQKVTDKLDKKLIDMQTLFEIGRELSSTLSVNDLIQIIIFTLIGQYQISDVAVFSIEKHQAKSIGKRGFSSLENFKLEDPFIDLLSDSNRTLSIEDIEIATDNSLYLTKQRCKNIIPMKGKDNLIGFILLGDRLTNAPLSEEDQHFTYTLSTLAGVSLETASLYERLDRKYNELSALYEISKVINSAQETDLVLDLIKETLSTGFGVKNGCILLKGSKDSWTISRVFSDNNDLKDQIYVLTAEEQLSLEDNKVEILSENKIFDSLPPSSENELFIPLFSVKNTLGAIVITDFDNYILHPENVELMNLFSIIASQISPPILMSQLIQKESTNVQDPYTPVVSAIQSAIDSAKRYKLDASFLKLSLQPYKTYIKLSKDSESVNPIETFVEDLSKLKREEDTIIRLSASSFLFILPAIAPTDIEDIRENVEQLLAKTFNQSNEIKLMCEWKTSRYPDAGTSASYLLNLLE